MISTVIFDFDGVVVDSVDIKTQAFVHLFRDYPEDIKRRIVDLHLNMPGVSRYEKFRIIYREFLNQTVTEEELKKIAAEFSRFCMGKIIAAPYIKGAYEFISEHYRDYDLYIASSAPEAELHAIVEARGIRSYFRGVFGTPSRKPEICRMILDRDMLSPKNVVLVGDSMSDLEAATQCGLHFIACANERSKDSLSRQPLRFRLPDLSNLSEVLLTHFMRETSQ